MKRSTLMLGIAVPALALMLYALFVPSSASNTSFFMRFVWDGDERESLEAWFAAIDTATSLRLDLEQVEAVETADAAHATRMALSARPLNGRPAERGVVGALTILAPPGVGDEAVQKVSDAARQELAALGAPTPRYPVTIALRRDETVRYHYRRTVVLPREAGAPCTVVIRERARSPQFAGITSGDRVLGTCAFFAVYGEPGRGMLEWLSETRMGTSAYLLDHEMAETVAARGQSSPVNVLRDSRDVAACRAGREEGCTRLFNAAEPDEGTSYLRDRVPSFHLPGVQSYDPNTLQAGTASAASTSGLLSALANTLGPAAFARVWQSDAGPAAAFEAETGDPLHTWVARQIARVVMEYQAGPLPPAGKLAMLTLLIGAIAGVTIRFTRRRLS